MGDSRHPRPGEGQRHGQGPRPEHHERREPRATEAPLPVDPAQRERALLLRAWESSPLTKSNFCVLKRISEADLDAQLAQARDERGGARPNR